MTTDQKRANLKGKVAAAQKRNEERSFADYARDAAGEATTFVKAHPIATVLGGLALGAIVASIVPGPGKRLRKKAGARSAVLAGALADLAIKYGSEFLDAAGDAARDGRSKLGDLGETIGDGSRSLRKEAGDAAGSATTKVTRAIRDLRSRVAH